MAAFGSGALLRANLLVGASAGALLISTPALAQATPEQPAPQPGSPAAQVEAVQAPPTDDAQQAAQAPTEDPRAGAAGADTAVIDERQIVVTGTRIRQPEFTSSDPVTRIDPQIAEQAGKIDLAETLQTSSIAAGSTQVTTALSSNFVTNGGPGAQTIDLRGLGPNRTLVLLNGRRAGPAGTRGGVSSFDLNVLPQSILQTVDILKTGASSVYGSDAVAGVVNLITRTDFDGLQLDVRGTVPTHAGGEQFQGSVLWGKAFDRGHVMVALDYFKQNELARGQRDYLACPPAYVFQDDGTGHASNNRADPIDPRTGKYACNDLPIGQVWTYDYEYNYLGAPGAIQIPGIPRANIGSTLLIQYQYPGETLNLPGFSPECGAFSCFSAPPGWFGVGYDPASTGVLNSYNPFSAEQTIIPKTSRYTLYADASYAISDNVEAYAEFLANRRKTYQNGWRQFWTFGYGPQGSYCAFFSCYAYDGNGTYLPPAPGQGGSVWAPDWNGLVLLSPTAVTNRGSDAKQKVDYWRAVGGVRGNLGFLKGWSYDAYVQYSHNKGLYSNEQIMQDVIDISYFQSQSCAGTTTPVSGKQCIDLPWTDPYFLLGQFTPEQANLLFDWETGKTTYKQVSAEASITGNVIDLPYGPLGLALGATVRRDEINDTPGAITLAGNAWGASASGVTAGHQTTNEVFGEVQVPLLKDITMFKDLSLNAAARLTNVKSVRASDGLTEKNSGNWTYKIGGNWAVTDWLRFRGTYGTSFRAPALFEEFKADETSFPSARAIDPCVNWAFKLQQGTISQTIADNCAAEGIPQNYGGGSISAIAHSSGGIGILEPETSTALTGSIIFTPRIPALPSTRLSFAVDYFDIKVKGEVAQLGAGAIVRGCYASQDYPNDPLCSLFDRGTQGTDPFAIGNVFDSYINIANQRNRGLDFTALWQQGLGRWGSLTVLGNATRQLESTFALFADQETDLLGIIQAVNGSAGQQKLNGNLNVTWKPRGGWTAFYGAEYYGPFSNDKIFIQQNGSLCPAQGSVAYGQYCVTTKVPAYWYHSASISKTFGEPRHELELTLGMRNILDTKPPRVSNLDITGLPALLGPAVATSQYDFLGRRVFFNISKKF